VCACVCLRERGCVKKRRGCVSVPTYLLDISELRRILVAMCVCVCVGVCVCVCEREKVCGCPNLSSKYSRIAS